MAVDIVSLTILFKEGKSSIKLQLESPPSPTSTATPLTSAASAPVPGGRPHAFGEAACVIICQPQLGRSTSSPTLYHHLLQDLGRGLCHCASPLHHHHHLRAPPRDHLRTTLTSTLTPTVRLRPRTGGVVGDSLGRGVAPSSAMLTAPWFLSSLSPCQPTHNMQIRHLKNEKLCNEKTLSNSQSTQSAMKVKVLN